MKLIGTHVDATLAARFSELARAHGGKSALLRRLVMRVVNHGENEPVTSLPDPSGSAVHLSIRLSENEVHEVRKGAKARGMKPAQWLRSIVRVRLGAGTQYTRDELHQLRGLTNQVRKVGVNLNQIARAANEARLEHSSFVVETEVLDEARKEVEKTLATLHQMARGNVRAWEGTHAQKE